MRYRVVAVVLALIAVIGGISLKGYFAPENVVRRSFLATIAAFESEQLLAVLSRVSRSYGDDWGNTYESLAGSIRDAFDTFDELHFDLELDPPVVDKDRVRIGFRFVLWGFAEGQRGYVLGSLSDPASATLVWQKERPGWRIVTTSSLDIPELQAELEARRSD